MLMFIAFILGGYLVLLKCKLGRVSILFAPVALMRMLAVFLRYGRHYEPAARTVLSRSCCQRSPRSCLRA